MMWMKTVRTLAYLAALLFAVTLFVPPTSVRCSNNVIPYSDMNKTIRDEMRKQKFLNLMRDKLLESDTFIRNSSAASSPRRATFSPLPQDKVPASNTPLQVSNNVSGMVRLVSGIGDTFLSSLAAPKMVPSESEEKNVLTFKFKPKIVGNRTLVNRMNLWLYVWSKEKDNTLSPSSSVSSSSPPPTTRDLKGDEQRNRRKGKRIKIRVFLSDVKGSRGQRIAELKTRIVGSTWGKLGLPVSLINTLTEADGNNTLRLRIECKRCSGNTKVLMPRNIDSKRCRNRQGVKKKKTDEKLRRWRKHCAKAEDVNGKLFPFIVIEEKSKTDQGRFRRALALSHHMATRNLTVSDQGANLSFDSPSSCTIADINCCKMITTYVDFSDLKLDYVIVYPSGFEHTICTRICGDMLDSSAKVAAGNFSIIADFVSEQIRSHANKSSGHLPYSSQTDDHQSLHHTNRHHKNQQKPQQHQLLQQLYSYHKRTRIDDSYSHKLSRLKQPAKCQPLKTENLVIVYFTHEHKLAQIHLPNFVVTRCGCHNHLPFVKN